MALDPQFIHRSAVLDLQELIHTPDGSVSAELTMDMSQMDFYGRKPIANPLTVAVNIHNHAGALVLDGTIHTLLEQCCDRCQISFQEEKTVPLHSLLADQLEDEEHEDIILLEAGKLNLEELATTTFILEMDTKTLCSEACEGLCSRCGVNLNQESCSCLQENHSPFAVLASLLDD